MKFLQNFYEKEINYIKMKYVNILTNKLNSPNGIAFLFPLVKFKKKFFENGFIFSFFSDINKKDLFECNFLIIDYRFLYGNFKKNLSHLMKILSDKRDGIDKIIFYDNSDSTGTLSNDIFEFVDIYLKNQILDDISLYSKKFYGSRIYTDYYFKKFNVIDDSVIFQKPVEKRNLNKIKVGWNSGLCEYSVLSAYKQNLIKNFKNPNILNFLSFNKKFIKPSIERINSLSCRIGDRYSRNTIRFQRKEINKKIKVFRKTNKISRINYFKELSNSKVVISPFGWGEISLRDFEVLLTGGLLFKPKMNHLKTWPNFFEEDKTIKCFDWSLSDLELNLEEILDNYKKYVSISIRGQKRYMEHTIDDRAFDLFFNHFKSIFN